MCLLERISPRYRGICSGICPLGGAGGHHIYRWNNRPGQGCDALPPGVSGLPGAVYPGGDDVREGGSHVGASSALFSIWTVPVCSCAAVSGYDDYPVPHVSLRAVGRDAAALSSGTGQRNHLLLAAASPGPVGGPSRPVFPAGPTLRRRCHDGGDGATDQ